MTRLDASGTDDANRAYYDAFSARYEAERGEASRGGYHDLVDELESGLVARYGAGREVLEVGCGTGLVLTRIARVARRATGVDLSPGMLEKARARGLDVQLASATTLPFPDATFDVACSFKVLAHVPDIDRALSEMARVVRPGGHVLAELYNPWSLRGLVKRTLPAGRIAEGADESHVYTRWDSPRAARRLTPVGCRWVGARGIRIVTPAALAMKGSLGRRVFSSLERRLCDGPLAAFGGFYIAIWQRR
ncbi:MAG: class I SAM-dependent methyltransferase [Polyangiaceae bacterium]|nr:class I SAM-dependent methyltransferase [Polyangiaceae bacterium]